MASLLTYTLFLPGTTIGSVLNVVDNSITLSRSGEVAAIYAPNGGGANISRNVLSLYPGGFGTVGTTTGIQIGTAAAPAVSTNLLRINENHVLGGAYGIYVVSSATALTNSYAIECTGNMLDKVQYDCIFISPSGAGKVTGELLIADNYLQNPNWANSGTAYAGIALGRLGGTLYGPSLIVNNRTSTHQGQAATNVWTAGMDLTVTTISGNTGNAQTTGGVLNPAILANSINGATWTGTVQVPYVAKALHSRGVYPYLAYFPFYPTVTQQKMLAYDPPTVPATVTVGTDPYGVAITPDGAYAYVCNNGSTTVSVIAVATNTVVATVTVGTNPFGVAITPDGAYTYICNSGTTTVSVIAVATNTVVATVTVGSQPNRCGHHPGRGVRIRLPTTAPPP